MQLKNIGKNYPIILASVGLPLTPIAYNDFSQSKLADVIQDSDMSKYRDSIEANSYKDFTLNIQFNSYLKQWREDTMFLSSIDKITNDSNFKNIVAMKEKAVPFIVKELSIKPSVLVWALNLIFDKKISNRDGLTVAEASKLWVNFLKKK